MVSIIIPVYNVEKYIEECLNSVLLQTYKNIQVIIIDDGSTDNSVEIIKKVIKNDKRIIFLNQKNKGVSVARNYALKFVKGEYIIFIDSDDYLSRDAIEKMMNKIEKNNSDLIICGYNKFYDLIITGENKNIFYKKEENKIYENSEVLKMLLEMEMEGYLWNKLFKTSKWNELELKFDEGRYVQDWFPVFKYIANCSGIMFINEPLYNYRQREGSAVNKKRKKFLEDYSYAVKKILNYTEKNNIRFNDDSKKYFEEYTYLQALQYYTYLNKKSGFKLYSAYDENKYLKLNNNSKSLFFNKKLNIKFKIVFLLWKLKILHFFK